MTPFDGDIERMGRAYRRVTVTVSRQPSWVLRLAVGAGLAVMTLVLVVLVIPALLIGLVVFLVAAAYASIRARLGFGRGGQRESGRQNVRVIRRP